MEGSPKQGGVDTAKEKGGKRIEEEMPKGIPTSAAKQAVAVGQACCRSVGIDIVSLLTR